MSGLHVHLYNWSVDEGVVKIVRDQPPGATSPDDLIAALDGEAPREVVERLQSAPESAAELADLARLQGGLQRALHRFDCPDPRTIVMTIVAIVVSLRTLQQMGR